MLKAPGVKYGPNKAKGVFVDSNGESKQLPKAIARLGTATFSTQTVVFSSCKPSVLTFKTYALTSSKWPFIAT